MHETVGFLCSQGERPCCWSWTKLDRTESFPWRASQLLTEWSQVPLFCHGEIYSFIVFACIVLYFHLIDPQTWSSEDQKGLSFFFVASVTACSTPTCRLPLFFLCFTVSVSLMAACFSDAVRSTAENLKQSPQMNNAWAVADNTLALSAALLSNHGDFLGSKHYFLSDSFFFLAQENELQGFLQENKHLNLQWFNSSHRSSEYEKVRGEEGLKLKYSFTELLTWLRFSSSCITASLASLWCSVVSGSHGLAMLVEETSFQFYIYRKKNHLHLSDLWHEVKTD